MFEVFVKYVKRLPVLPLVLVQTIYVHHRLFRVSIFLV